MIELALAIHLEALYQAQRQAKLHNPRFREPQEYSIDVLYTRDQWWARWGRFVLPRFRTVRL